LDPYKVAKCQNLLLLALFLIVSRKQKRAGGFGQNALVFFLLPGRHLRVLRREADVGHLLLAA
jgi:hypothetical protein